MTPLDITVHLEGDEAVLTLAGELDLAARDAVTSSLEGLNGDYARILLDVEALTFIDSSGLGVIARTRARLPETTELIVRNADPRVRRAFTIAGLDDLVQP